MICFDPLGQDAMEAIARKYLDQLQQRLGIQGVTLQLPEDLACQLARDCKARDGARQLRRMVQERVEGPLAEYLLRNSRKTGKLRGLMEGGQLCFQCCGAALPGN